MLYPKSPGISRKREAALTGAVIQRWQRRRSKGRLGTGFLPLHGDEMWSAQGGAVAMLWTFLPILHKGLNFGRERFQYVSALHRSATTE